MSSLFASTARRALAAKIKEKHTPQYKIQDLVRETFYEHAIDAHPKQIELYHLAIMIRLKTTYSAVESFSKTDMKEFIEEYLKEYHII